jgi:hypothetical protein
VKFADLKASGSTVDEVAADEEAPEWHDWANQFLRGDMKSEVFLATFRAYVGEAKWEANEAYKAAVKASRRVQAAPCAATSSSRKVRRGPRP